MINIVQQFIYTSLACSYKASLVLLSKCRTNPMDLSYIIYDLFFAFIKYIWKCHTHIIYLIYCNLRPAANHSVCWIESLAHRHWSCSCTFISRYHRTGKDKRSTLNMATRCMLRTVLNSFAGLNLGATNINVNAQKWINVPRISAAAFQCRGLRQGEVFPKMI